MGILKIIRNTNSGLSYMNNALNYVLGGHTDFDKRYSPNVDIYNAYDQFLYVKNYFGKTSGNPVFHFIVVFNSRSTYGNDYHVAELMSYRIAAHFANKYQIVYGIHKKVTSKKNGGKCASFYHVHFVMNSVSYIDGKMFSGRRSDIYELLELIKQVTRDNSWTVEYGSDKESRI